MPSRERIAKRRAEGKCPTCGRPFPGGFYRCKRCWEINEARWGAMKAGADEQDLSAYPVLSKGDRGGLRYVSGFFPWPAKTKHTRTALTAKPGFRPLTTPAKKYQQFVAQAVLVQGLIGWIRPGSEYILEVIVMGHRSDADQYTTGLQDDLVKSGLMADDKHCEATVSRRYNISKDKEKVLYVAVYETEKGKSDG